MERLQKILSQAGIASRRTSEQLMLEGRVTVNGAPVRELGTKADPQQDDIRVDGRRIKLPEHYRYVLLNKPTGYVTTRSDPQRRPTVMDLIGGVREYVYPVGRLDFDTEGLLLLTNDGDLAATLTHPRHGVERVYEVKVLGVPDTRDIERLSRGVTIEGRRTQPALVQLGPGRHEGHAVLRITITEGRNRQVRKMFDAIGHPVDYLRRISIGPLRDMKLRQGQWRDLTDAEVASLKRAATRGASGDSRPSRPTARKPRPAAGTESGGPPRPKSAGAGRPGAKPRTRNTRPGGAGRTGTPKPGGSRRSGAPRRKTAGRGPRR